MSELRDILSSFQKVDLSIVDKSPISRLHNIEKKLNTDVKIYIKRDDMLRPYFGNKLRYIEYIFGHYKQSGCDCIVHAGGASSNYMGQLAMAGAIKNIPMHIVLNENPDILQGNTLIEKLFGANMYFLKSTRNTNSKIKETVKNKIINKGGKPYVIDYPYGNFLAYMGYMEAFDEIIDQRNNGCIKDIDHIYLCSGHHSYMGLKFGEYLLNEKINIVAIKAGYWKNFENFKSQKDFINKKIKEFSKFLDVKFEIDNINLLEDFVGDDYGLASEDSLKALHLLAKYEGIILDPIYSAKAFAGLVKHIETGEIANKESVLFIHTGGTFNVFNYNVEISNYKIKN
jgi:1-aminocyclopropane-1-carboxylate deaminase/D-cysteine desulfhydrase-like pyridoxal-dependent ACC family enzyme